MLSDTHMAVVANKGDRCRRPETRRSSSRPRPSLRRVQRQHRRGAWNVWRISVTVWIILATSLVGLYFWCGDGEPSSSATSDTLTRIDLVSWRQTRFSDLLQLPFTDVFHEQSTDTKAAFMEYGGTLFGAAESDSDEPVSITVVVVSPPGEFGSCFTSKVASTLNHVFEFYEAELEIHASDLIPEYIVELEKYLKSYLDRGGHAVIVNSVDPLSLSHDDIKMNLLVTFTEVISKRHKKMALFFLISAPKEVYEDRQRTGEWTNEHGFEIVKDVLTPDWRTVTSDSEMKRLAALSRRVVVLNDDIRSEFVHNCGNYEEEPIVLEPSFRFDPVEYLYSDRKIIYKT